MPFRELGFGKWIKPRQPAQLVLGERHGLILAGANDD
jgi:hypothetical protein